MSEQLNPRVLLVDSERARYLANRLRAWKKYVQTSELKRVVAESAAMLDQVAASVPEEVDQ